MTTRPLQRAAQLPRGARFVAIGQEHAGLLADLFERNAELETSGVFHPFPLTAASARRIALGERSDLYFGAQRRDELIGMAMLRGWDEGYEVPSFGIMVDRAHRGRSVGRRLTELTMEQARAHGCPRVRLSVYASNAAARRLYERLGFAEIERTPMKVAGRDDERIVMMLELAGS
jgi:ribosomal protein S18 acetylase RimI-like enzyme